MVSQSFSLQTICIPAHGWQICEKSSRQAPKDREAQINWHKVINQFRISEGIMRSFSLLVSEGVCILSWHLFSLSILLWFTTLSHNNINDSDACAQKGVNIQRYQVNWYSLGAIPCTGYVLWLCNNTDLRPHIANLSLITQKQQTYSVVLVPSCYIPTEGHPFTVWNRASHSVQTGDLTNNCSLSGFSLSDSRGHALTKAGPWFHPISYAQMLVWHQ